MGQQYAKVKSPSKVVAVKSRELQAKVINTMSTIRAIVGATLGPGGTAVLIERNEYGLPNMVTKDGVTVFKSLGFTDPVSHAIMEAARDAAIRTANEAGDGTTTATVLAEAIGRYTQEYTTANPKVSPQRVVRRLEELFREIIEPTITSLAISPTLSTDDGRHLLHSVAKVSGNGDVPLADAVIECFDVVGDEGNVTISELSGASHYEVEQINGYPIPKGYEESCAKYHPIFVNDIPNQRTSLTKPVFILYHGQMAEPNNLIGITGAIMNAWQKDGFCHNVIVVATGFSDSMLSAMAFNFPLGGTLNIVPLLAPMTPMPNSQLHFLEDLRAITGAQIFDPVENPLPAPNAEIAPEELPGLVGYGIDSFEGYRFRSNIIGHADEVLLVDRVEALKVQAQSAESQLDKSLLEERIGKLTGGIARLKVFGASNGELREKRDRAEDAVCAVRGAIKHGVLPAGGWTLLKLVQLLVTKAADDDVAMSVLAPALIEPVHMLLSNAGLSQEESKTVIVELQAKMRGLKNVRNAEIYDALDGKFVKAFKAGLLDSTPAVLEAVRNSISIAGLLGTLGGVVVFHRDIELERRESIETNQFMRQAGAENPADERA